MIIPPCTVQLSYTSAKYPFLATFWIATNFISLVLIGKAEKKILGSIYRYPKSYLWHCSDKLGLLSKLLIHLTTTISFFPMTKTEEKDRRRRRSEDGSQSDEHRGRRKHKVSKSDGKKKARSRSRSRSSNSSKSSSYSRERDHKRSKKYKKKKSRSKSRKKDDRKQKKERKRKKREKRRHDDDDSSGSSSSSGEDGLNVKRSVITGKKIKMHIDKDDDDRVRDKGKTKY